VKRTTKRPAGKRPAAYRQKKRRLKNGVWYVIMLVSLSLLAWGYNSITRYLNTAKATFELEQIEISGNKVLSRAEILKQLGLPEKGMRLLEIDPATVREKLSKLPFVKNVTAVHSLPATLRIRVEERRPVAYVYGRGLNLIDKEGFLLPLPAGPLTWNLPVIRHIPEKLGVQGAYTTAPMLRKAVAMVAFINHLQAPLPELVSELDFSSREYLRITLSQGARELRVDYDNYPRQLYKAAGFFRDYVDFTPSAMLAYVDARFENQIVTKKKSKS